MKTTTKSSLLLLVALTTLMYAHARAQNALTIDQDEVEMLIPAVLATNDKDTTAPMLISQAKQHLTSYNEELVKNTPAPAILQKLKDSQKVTHDRSEFKTVVGVCDVDTYGAQLCTINNGKLDSYKMGLFSIPKMFAADLHYNKEDALNPKIVFRIASKEKQQLQKLSNEQRGYIKHLYTTSAKNKIVQISAEQLETHKSLPADMQKTLEQNYEIPAVQEFRKQNERIKIKVVAAHMASSTASFLQNYVLPDTNDQFGWMQMIHTLCGIG